MVWNVYFAFQKIWNYLECADNTNKNSSASTVEYNNGTGVNGSLVYVVFLSIWYLN